MAQLLLRITSKPMLYERSVQPARLEMSRKDPQMTITKQGGTMEIQQQPVQMQMDSTAYRDSLGFKTQAEFSAQAADAGAQMAMQATADYVDVGNQMAKAHKGVTVIDAALSKLSKYAQAELVMVPLNPIEISWNPGGASFNYTPVNLNIDWNIQAQQTEFVPSSTSMNITQYPSVQIEYLGGPVYAPPSADPNFQSQA